MRPRKKDEDGVTLAERIFCYQFILTGSQRESARAAWKCKTDQVADNFGYQAMRKPHILNYMAKLRKESQGSPQEVCEQAKKTIQELALISFSDIRDYMDALNMPDDVKNQIKEMGPASRAISEINIEETGGEVKTRKIKFKLHSKTAALEMLGKHHKLYTDLVHHTGNIVAPQIYQLPENGMGAKEKK